MRDAAAHVAAVGRFLLHVRGALMAPPRHAFAASVCAALRHVKRRDRARPEPANRLGLHVPH